jgi:hypothetical protein
MSTLKWCESIVFQVLYDKYVNGFIKIMIKQLNLPFLKT